MASLHLPCASISVMLPRAALPELCNACPLLSETTWCRSNRETFSMDVASLEQQEPGKGHSHGQCWHLAGELRVRVNGAFTPHCSTLF